MRVSDPIYGADPINAKQVETVLSTITALEAGKGPALETDPNGRIDQISRFSGQPSDVVKTIYEAYQKVGDVNVTTSKKIAPETTTATGEKKVPTFVLVGGLAALLLLFFMAVKKGTAR